MINNLKIEHFKAFRDMAELKVEDKNVLIFGENGAGKSSLFQALKLVFHRKKIIELHNITSITDLNERQRAENDFLNSYNHQQSPLTNFNIEINGVDYKLFNTSGYAVSMISRDDIRVEDKIDVAKVLGEALVGIADPATFIIDTKDTIETLVNHFLKEYFFEENMTVELVYNKPNWFLRITDSNRGNLTRYENLTEFFNEAKLHIIKILLLFTAVLYNGAKERGDIRILVLDDVITSMDAANRTLFVRLLNKYFGEYQMVVMTHSISFFNMADYSLSIAYGQKADWKRYQIVEHDGSSEIMEKESQDYASNINKEYKKAKQKGLPLDPIGNLIRKRFEFLVGEVAKLLYTGGIAESSRLIEAVNTPKKLYYEYDGSKTKTVYDLVDELVGIIEAAPVSTLRTDLKNVIDRYVSGDEVDKLRETICELAIYQKVSMHPMSHAAGTVPITATKEIERSITLLMLLEKQLGTLIGRDMYSI